MKDTGTVSVVEGIELGCGKRAEDEGLSVVFGPEQRIIIERPAMSDIYSSIHTCIYKQLLLQVFPDNCLLFN